MSLKINPEVCPLVDSRSHGTDSQDEPPTIGSIRKGLWWDTNTTSRWDLAKSGRRPQTHGLALDVWDSLKDLSWNQWNSCRPSVSQNIKIEKHYMDQHISHPYDTEKNRKHSPMKCYLKFFHVLDTGETAVRKKQVLSLPSHSTDDRPMKYT